ncbi:MAG: prephenate dehydratase, partial [Candidatus Eisenbacteria bacterium]|nr:prephenate dehydratase [Candidatus Eisenbacteria bacterium]
WRSISRRTFPPGSTGHARLPGARSFSAVSPSYGDREGGGSLSEDREDFAHLREEIERLDDEILTLLARRMAAVDLVAEAKLERAIPFRDQPREDLVLQRVRQAAVEHGLDAHRIERLYRDIMDMSVARQQAYLSARDTVPLRIGYQGVEGAYSHLAAQRRYAQRPGGAHLTGFKTFHEVFAAVGDGRIDVALLPIENTTAGSINETYDLLAESGLTITSEVVSRIEHCLLGLPGASLEELRVVISHPQALRQSARFLRDLAGVETREEYDTAGSARKVREQGDPTWAAIASESAARLHGLEILARGIETQSGNFTRFVEVAREAVPCPHDAACKTSLLLVLSQSTPGALAALLQEFARRGLNLTKLESRPLPESPWRYRFYLDVQGHQDTAPMRDVIAAIAPYVEMVNVLGTYPEADRKA